MGVFTVRDVPVDRRERLGYVPLEPASWLGRSARVFADRAAVIDDDVAYTYAEFDARVDRIVGALAALQVDPNDRVAVLCPNTHVMLALHYAIPRSGAAIVALNFRLSARELAGILEHCGARLMFYDGEFASLAAEVLDLRNGDVTGIRCGAKDDVFESLLGDALPSPGVVPDEMSMIALNYTSGTTGKPKGVMYSHRGSYMQSLAMAYHARLDAASVYLWTLPMFHCCGWSFTWAVTAAGATHRCVRKIDTSTIWRHLRESEISHFCAAPTLLVMIAHDESSSRGKPSRAVRVFTGGAPPSPALLQRAAELGFDVHHLYGMTESYGPAVICEWRDEWNSLAIPDQAAIKARQGVGNIVAQEVRVVDSVGRDVPADGKTVGEIVLRGNNVMLGYYRDAPATRAAVPDGWLRTGDIGVMEADRYVRVTDRSKDIIISGGENIASIEVEHMLERHPDILEAAVVAAPDATWGEVPVAFVVLREESTVDEAALVAYARANIARFKAPKRFVFGQLPKTGTGKIQKFALRERAKELAAGSTAEQR